MSRPETPWQGVKGRAYPRRHYFGPGRIPQMGHAGTPDLDDHCAGSRQQATDIAIVRLSMAVESIKRLLTQT
ncbi:hypothetical protein, partial [Mesorhizobium sp. M2A.F.Ca.ET.039.01.1.1]|uniref:hypothetical protein n=1 Tax=Mesorhizobium sp. M2A.F.Ca.ET.039.01.1.1 TaxID=2496746 RepID=UPI001AECBBB2